jgi:hypothetical protein
MVFIFKYLTHPTLTAYENVNLKFINNLNVRAKNLKLSEENIEVNLH